MESEPPPASPPRAPPSAAAGASLVARFLASEQQQPDGDLTVEAWLKSHLARLVKAAEDGVDDAVDTLLLTHKQAREELRNWQHQRVAEQAVRHKAARKVTWDIRLTVEGTGEEGEAAVGRTFTLQPRQRNGGMCRIGRSTGGDFVEPRGASLPFDCSISVWHGKFTAVYGQVFYSDLNTRNGSLHNGCVVRARGAGAGPPKRGRSALAHRARCTHTHTRTHAQRLRAPPPSRSAPVEKDKPILLSDGDELGLGDVRLRVRLERAAHEEAEAENAGGEA